MSPVARNRKGLRQGAARRALGVGEADALQHDHRSQRRQERRHPPIGDEIAVDAADQGAEQQGGDEGGGGVVERADGEHRRGRHDRRHGEVQAPHDDHDHLADDDKAERCGLDQNIGDVLDAEKPRRQHCCDCPDQDQEAQQQQDFAGLPAPDRTAAAEELRDHDRALTTNSETATTMMTPSTIHR